MLSSGELLIRSAKPADSTHSFRCTLHNVLTGQSTVSQSAGKIIVTGECVEIAALRRRELEVRTEHFSSLRA